VVFISRPKARGKPCVWITAKTHVRDISPAFCPDKRTTIYLLDYSLNLPNMCIGGLSIVVLFVFLLSARRFFFCLEYIEFCALSYHFFISFLPYSYFKLPCFRFSFLSLFPFSTLLFLFTIPFFYRNFPFVIPFLLLFFPSSDPLLFYPSRSSVLVLLYFLISVFSFICNSN
jgi:hypothetical protein